MKVYKRLAESDRHLRRTVMDALVVLCKQAGFQDDDRAEFHISLLLLPSSDKVGLIDIHFDCPARETIDIVSLPTSTHFNAREQGRDFPRRIDIRRLDRAVIDARGHAQLTDGSKLRAIDIERLCLPNNPSNLEWIIVHLTLELIGAVHCYRSLQEGLSPNDQSMVPDLRFLDVARLSGLVVPSLQELTRYIARRYKRVSGQQIANTLRKFGVRHPQARAA
jgi:hypothetical protein